MTVEDKSSPLDLRVIEARHPTTVVLEAGEHHSQDVRERIQAQVDVTALLVHCRMLRAALEDGKTAVISLAQPENIRKKPWLADMANAFLDTAISALASCTDKEL